MMAQLAAPSLMIRTPRLHLRDFVIADLDAVHAYASDPLVTRYTSFGPNTREETETFLSTAVRESNERQRTTYDLAVIHTASDQLIGSGGIRRTDINGPQFTLGYILHRDWWRQGFGREVAAGLMKFGFDQLRAYRIWSHVFVGNTASARILEGLGFRMEGCARRALFIRQTWHDVATFAMLRDEWRAHSQQPLGA